MEELMAKEEMRINLSAVKRIDPEVEEIVSRAKQVALYDYNSTKEEWKLTEVIGVLFACKRNTEPYYSIVIMNRQNDENFIKPIIKQLEWQFFPPFLLYQSCQEIQGIWFYNQDECDCVTTFVTQIVECMQMIEADESKQEEIGKKMLTIVTKAQEDYFKSALSSRPLDSKQPPSIKKSNRNPSTSVKINEGDKNKSSVTKSVQKDTSISKEVCSNSKPSDTAPLCTTPCQTPSPIHQRGVSTVTVVIQKNRQRRPRGMRKNSKYLNDNATPFAAPASADHNVKATIKSPSPFKSCIEYPWMSSSPLPDKFSSRSSSESDESPPAPRKLDEADSKQHEHITQITSVKSVTSTLDNDDKNDDIKTKNSSSRTLISRRLIYSSESIAHDCSSNESKDTDIDVSGPLTTMVFNNTKHLEIDFSAIPLELRRTKNTTHLKPNKSSNVGTDDKKDSRSRTARRLNYFSKKQSKGKYSDTQPSSREVFNNAKHLEKGNPTIPSELKRTEDITQLKTNKSSTLNVGTDDKKDTIKPKHSRSRRSAARRLSKQSKDKDSDNQPSTLEVLNNTKHLNNDFPTVPLELKPSEDITQLKLNKSPTSNPISTVPSSPSKQNNNQSNNCPPSISLGLCNPKHFENDVPTASLELKRSENKTLLTPITSATSNVGNDGKNNSDKSKIILLRRPTSTELNNSSTSTPHASPSKQNKDQGIHGQPTTSLGIYNPKHFENDVPTTSSELKRPENKTLFTPITSATSNVGNDNKNNSDKPKIILMRRPTFTATSNMGNDGRNNSDKPKIILLPRPTSTELNDFAASTARPSPSKQSKDQSIHGRPSTALGLYNPKPFENGVSTTSSEFKRSENKTLFTSVTSATSNVGNDDKNNSEKSKIILLRRPISTELNDSVTPTPHTSPKQSKDQGIHGQPSTALGLYNPKPFQNGVSTASSEMKRSENKTITPIASATSNVGNGDKNNSDKPKIILLRRPTSTEVNDSATPTPHTSPFKQSKDQGIHGRPSTALGLYNPKPFENGVSTVSSELKRSDNKTQFTPVISATSNVDNDVKNNTDRLKIIILRRQTSKELNDSATSIARLSPSKQSKDQGIHGRPSTALGLYNPEHFENDVPTASSELKRSDNKTQFTLVTSATSNVGNDEKNISVKPKISYLRSSSSTELNDSFTTRPSSSKVIQCRSSTSLGLSNPKYFENNYPTAPASPNNLPDYRPGSIKEYFMKIRTKVKDNRSSASLIFTNSKYIENNYSLKASSSAPTKIFDNRPKSTEKPIPKIISKSPLKLSELCYDNIKEFIPKNFPAPTSTKIPDFPPGSIKEYFSKLRKKGKNDYSKQNGPLIPTKLPNYHPENIKEYFSKIRPKGNDGYFLNSDPYTSTKLPDFRPGSIKEYFSKGTPESHLFTQCRRFKTIYKGNEKLAVTLKDDVDDSATLKQKGKNLRRYVSSHTLEEVQTRSDTTTPFSLTKPSTPKSPNFERRMLPVIPEDNQNVFIVHLLQALQHLVETDPTVLPKLHDAYGKYLDLNLQYE